MYKEKSSTWWSLMESRTSKLKTLPQGFCNLIHNLLSCPPSSASIERLFSTFGLIWTKLRNKMGVEKATKLVKINKFLNKK